MPVPASALTYVRPTPTVFELEALEGLPCGCVAAAYRAKPWDVAVVSLEAKGPHCILAGHASGQVLRLGDPAEFDDDEDDDAAQLAIVPFVQGEIGESGFLFGRFGGPFHGLGLPEGVLKKIYSQNFERMAGSQPGALNPEAIIAECERLGALIPMMGAAQPDAPMDLSVVNMVKEHFHKTGGRVAPNVL